MGLLGGIAGGIGKKVKEALGQDEITQVRNREERERRAKEADELRYQRHVARMKTSRDLAKAEVSRDVRAARNPPPLPKWQGGGIPTIFDMGGGSGGGGHSSTRNVQRSPSIFDLGAGGGSEVHDLFGLGGPSKKKAAPRHKKNSKGTTIIIK
jgi:hypothetical protein